MGGVKVALSSRDMKIAIFWVPEYFRTALYRSGGLSPGKGLDDVT